MSDKTYTCKSEDLFKAIDDDNANYDGEKRISNIIIYKEFMNNGSTKREKEDLTYHLFKNLDYRQDNISTSFSRSDFRGSKFIDTYFFNNNFDRADFIDISFINCNFIDTLLGMSEIKNAYFENCTFSKNIYNATSIQKSIFVNCQFIDEMFLVNMHDCDFRKCVFTDCSFERSTTEDINFYETELKRCELSTMHAENYRFTKCILEDIVFGREYWCTYFFKDTSLKDSKFKYRGEYVYLYNNTEYTKNYLIELLSCSRYCEFLNVNIIFSDQRSIYSLFLKTVTNIMEESNELIRKRNMLNVFEMLEFYFNSEKISLHDFLLINKFFSTYDFKNISFVEKLEYKSKIFKLEELISNMEFSLNHIYGLPSNLMAIGKICFDIEDRKEAEVCLDNIFLELNKGNRWGFPENKKAYHILSATKGSWQFEIITNLSCILLLAKVLKYIANSVVQITFKAKFSSQLLETTRNQNIHLKDYQKFINMSKQTGLIDTKKDVSLEKLLNPKYLEKVRSLFIESDAQ